MSCFWRHCSLAFKRALINVFGLLSERRIIDCELIKPAFTRFIVGEEDGIESDAKNSRNFGKIASIYCFADPKKKKQPIGDVWLLIRPL